MNRQGLFDEIMPVSRTSTEIQKTGLWGRLKPVYEEALAPCRESCPLGTDIPLFISYIREKDFRRAKEVVLSENPFPGICGRVCHHPCQEVCNRKEYDLNVEIRALERFLGDYPFHHIPILENRDPKRIAIVGSGPAGLSCAYFLSRLGHKVTIFEKEKNLGGLLYYGIPSYRLPREVVQKEIQTLLALNPILKLNSELKGNEILSLLSSFDYVFLGSGLCQAKELKVKGADKKGLYYGFEFLRNVKAVKEEVRRAIVIGGGDVAMDAARTIRRLKPDAKVSIFAPEKVDELPALRENLEETREEGIDIIGGYLPFSFEGKKKIEVVIFQATEVKRNEDTGELIFIPKHEEREELADIVIVCIGQKVKPETNLMELVDKKGFVSIDGRGETNVKKIYAGGDMIGQKASVSHALASGKKAAISIDMDAKGLNLDIKEFTIGANNSVSFKKYLGLEKKNTKKVIGFQLLNTIPSDKTTPVAIKKENPENRAKDFREVARTIEEEEAIKESERCLSCGQCKRCNLCFYLCPDVSVIKREDGLYEVDYGYCKSCGICARTCPCHIIELVEKDGGTVIG